MQDKEPKIVGAAYKQLIPLVKKYAESDLPVLFVGETGSGKEVFAKHYLNSSGRKGEKMTRNCAAYLDALLMSEIFGHVKGAFTGASDKREGVLRTCTNGIVFLDELGEASPEFQAAILRISEGNSFSPVGSDKEFPANTLIIAATNNLTKVREDLKQRFHIFPIPPLQKFDIPALAEYFLKKPIKKEVLNELMACDYPGHVRELKKLCEKLSVERGDAIFGKKETDIGIETGTFDYERFRHEYSLWEKYITPILLEHNLNFKYKFFPIQTLPEVEKDDEPLTLGMRTARMRIGLGPGDVEPAKSDPGKEMADLVRKLLIEKGGEKPIKSFTALLNGCLRDEKLDLLLNSIDHHIGHNDQPQRFKPNLIALLNLNFREALIKFKAEYLNYHLQIHNQNRSETAKAIGMNKKTFESTIGRLKSILKTASTPKNKLNSPNS